MTTKKTPTVEKLERLASHQGAWSSLAATDKLALLQNVRGRVSQYDGFRGAADQCVKETMGIPLHTEEGDFQSSVEMIILITAFTSTLDYLIKTYKVFAGQEKVDLPVRQMANGQWAVQVHPYIDSEKSGPLSNIVGEVYLDPDKVNSKDDIHFFDWETIVQNGKGPGAAIVLGAGNFSLLTVGDCLSVLFRSNRCALVKHHPLREYLDDALRFILAPLMEAGYLDFQKEEDFDRQAVYSDKVALVHMTGGKRTHDMIVWGPTEKEQADRRRKGDPLLKATMTSELGCVTPWIIPQCTMTTKELQSQAHNIAKAAYQNCSFACNSPKIVIVSHDWEQREELVDNIVKFFRTHRNPAAYYPGAQDRWQAFKENASPQCMEITCDMDVQKRGLLKPLMQKEPVLLPWLINRIDVDLTTPKGVESASNEYFLRNEPFAPMLTICTVQSTTGPSDYLKTAVKLCNEHIFGSLSASMTVPDSLKDDPDIEKALSHLKYGSITVNAWTAFGYAMKGLPWGAHPGEKLEAVESGIGIINQFCFIPHALKGVVKFPVSGVPTIILPEETRENAAINRALADLVKSPGVFVILNLIWCLVKAQFVALLKAVKVL